MATMNPDSNNDSDTHIGARRAALRLLEEFGLVKSTNGKITQAKLQQLVDRVSLVGSKVPFVPSPWRVTDALTGAHIVMGVLCALLEGSRGRDCAAEIDAEAATFVAFAQFSSEWEGVGMWHGTVAKFNEMLAAKMGIQPPVPMPVQAASSATEEEPLVDPPANTPGVSPVFATVRGFLSDVFETKDRHIFFFMLSQDHPTKYLAGVGFNEDEVRHMIRLAITTPLTHPKTYLKNHEEFLVRLKTRVKEQMAFDIQARMQKIPAIAVVPLTRDEFYQTEQGRALKDLPRVQIERHTSVRGPWSVEEWKARKATEEAKKGRDELWQETGWRYGSVPRLLPTRGVLYGLKVLEVTRIINGPMAGLQLSELGADVIRISAPDWFDYPSHELNINLNKRSVMLDLKSEGGKRKMRELIGQADVFINNLLAGSLEKLGFGLKDVLEMVKDRPRGIVYAEANTFGYFGPLVAQPGVELIGQHISGLSVVHGQYQPFTDPKAKIPCITPMCLCDVMTGISVAAGVLSALVQRTEQGGSYLVRGSLTQTGLFIQDLGIYKDEAMVRALWNGYPLHDTEVRADTTKAVHVGDLDYMARFPAWMKERGDVRGAQFESGFWMRTVDNPLGGSGKVVSFLPPLKLSVHSPKMEHLRFVSRQLRYDTYTGFLFDPEDPEGSDEGVRDLVPTNEERTYRVRPKSELDVEIARFLKGKGRAAPQGEGGRDSRM